MDLQGWNERYQSATEVGPPSWLLQQLAAELNPGRALDLACGLGQNALWLARRGWQVTAIDGASAAIATLSRTAAAENLAIDARTVDLEAGAEDFGSDTYDLIVDCYYLQRDLFPAMKRAVRPGGCVLAIVHTAEEGEVATAHRLLPGELPDYFSGWEILHHYEGMPHDGAHRRRATEIVARRQLTR